MKCPKCSYKTFQCLQCGHILVTDKPSAMSEHYRKRLFDALLGDIASITPLESMRDEYARTRAILEDVAARDLEAIEPIINEMLAEPDELRLVVTELLTWYETNHPTNPYPTFGYQNLRTLWLRIAGIIHA